MTPRFAAALLLLAAHDRLRPYVHVTQERVDWEGYDRIYASLSTGEQCVVDAAEALYHGGQGTGRFDLWRASCVLDVDNWRLLIDAMCVAREMPLRSTTKGAA